MSRRSRITVAVLCCLLPAVLPVSATTSAIASAARSVRVGVAPTLPSGARALGALEGATELHVTLALEPRNPGALASYAQAVSTPGSSEYGRYLTTAQFARRFGAAPAAIAAVRDALLARGLSPGRASVNDLSIPVTATAGALDQALSLKLERIAIPGGERAITASAAPAVPAAVAPLVQAVIGLDTTSSPKPLALRPGTRPRTAVAHTRGHVATGGPQPCAAASNAAPSNAAYTADELASAYGFSGLYHAGDEGQGQTIALYELEPDNPSDVATFQSCYGTHATVTYVPVDGGAGAGAGSGEAALDIEDAISLAPKANVIVYQAPNANSNGPGSGPYDNFSAIVSQDRAQVVSASWGQCESMEGSSDAHAENALFEEAAAQGQTIVSAAGDDGSEDCFTGNPLVGTQLAVDDPASQPFVTGVGGTTLSTLGPRPTESVWNNGSNLVSSTLGAPGAGGGGLSSLWSMPTYQSGAASSLHVLGAPAGGGCGAARCREVPDVSADADPNTGYLIYFNGDGSESGASGWQGIGGTSAAAPLWAALFALANASGACAGTDLGFANPGLYRAAATGYAAGFNDVRSGNNDFTGTNGSDYAAANGYDLATGLGTPNASSLVPALCAQTLRVANPGSQSTTVHAKVSLRLRSYGAASRFSATGLPAGLSIGSGTGAISGKPRSIGTHHVTVTARNDSGAVSTTSFSWTVGDPPRITRASLAGVSSAHPQLRLTLAAGRGAPFLSAVSISPPSGLRFAARPRLSISGRRGFLARLIGKSIVLAMSTPARSLTITIAYPSLRLQHPLAGRITVAVTVLDASLKNSTRLKARIRVG